MEEHEYRQRRLTPLITLVGADAISELGKVVTSVAIPWLVLQTTESAAKIGLVAASMVLGFVIAGFFGGPLVDRIGLKSCSVVSDVGSGLAVTIIPLLYGTIGLAFWQLVTLTFLVAFLGTPGKIARRGLVPQLADSADIRLERANSVYLSLGRLAQLLGPALAGVLIVVLAANNTLWVNAATFALSAIAVLVFVPNLPRVSNSETKNTRGRGGYFAELSTGLRFIRKDALILSIVLVYTVTEFLDAPLIPVILPVYANSVYGSATALGLMVAALGAGALAGSLLFGAVAHRLHKGRTFVWSMIAMQAPFWMLAMTPTLPIALLGLFVTGAAAGLLNVLLHTVVQDRTPQEILGRVLGAFFALGMAAVPLGMVIAGYALELIGLSGTIVVLAACYGIVTLGLLLNPALRKMNISSVEK